MKRFCKAHEEDLVPGIDKDNITTSEDKMPVHAIPNEGESVKPNENSDKSS